MTSAACKGEFREEEHPRGHGGKFTDGAGGKDAPMHERTAPGGDLHERATASLRTNAFVLEHQHRLGAAGDEVRAKYPRHEQYTDAVHNQAQQAIHTEAMRIHHEQDAIGGNPYAQNRADFVRQTGASWRHEDLAAQHASVMNELASWHGADAASHQRDLDAQSRGFADHSAEQAHHQSLRDADSQSRGFANQEAETEHLRVEQERTERAAEDKAIAAGHVSSEPRDVVDQHIASDDARRAAAEQHAEALDRAHGAAADALAALHAYGSEDHERLDTSDIIKGEHFNDTQSALHEAIGLDEHGGYERGVASHDAPQHPDDADLAEGERYQPHESSADNAPFAHHAGLEYVPHPDRSDRDLTDEEYAHQLAAHEAWSAKAEAVHGEAMAAHEAEFKRRAGAAQTALETLHERQIATHEALKASDKDSTGARRAVEKRLDALSNNDGEDLVNHAAFAHHERDYGTEDNKPAHPSDAHDPEYLVDDHARQDYENAHAAAETMLARASDRLENHSHLNVDDVFEPLKDSMRSTRDSIKALAKITGREARLPAAAARTKKSANRPGTEPGGSVWGMAAPARYKLRLTKLDFLSLVDTPAQETAAIRLVKRKDGASEMDATLHARVVKWTEGDDPLVYCWAFTCTDAQGQPYHDLQGDAITPDFIKAAEAFMVAGGAVDEMHDSEQKSRIAFAYPMDPDIAKAMLGEAAGAAVKQSGLMVAIRPTADQLAKIKSGDYTGVSIAGTGIRELVKAAAPKCPSCGAYGKADDKDCPSCGKAMKRRPAAEPTTKSVWTTADIDQLPDSSFLYVEGGGTKDKDGKTTPRSLRHFPYRDGGGAIDLPHLRDTIGRIPQSSLPKDVRDKLQVRAEKLLGAQHSKRAPVRKQAVLTSVTDGHQHQIDLDDPADGWSDQLTTSFNNSAGADAGHCHAWVYDDAGKITIALDSGHAHTISDVVPADVIAQAKLNDTGSRCPGCGEMCEAGCRFCSKCGCAMDRRDAVPAAVSDEGSGSAPAVIVIAARAPAAISPPSGEVSTVKGDKEPIAMADQTDSRIRALEAENVQLKKMASMTDAHRSHFAKLAEQDQINFLNMTPSQRDTVLDEIAKADEVVYESPYTKRVYRKSDLFERVEAAREADASKAVREQLQSDRRDHEFNKRGEQTLSQFAKGAKGDLRARIMKAIGAEFTVPAEHDEAVKALKGANVALEMLTKTTGSSQADEPTGELPPKAALEKLAADYAKANNVPIHKAHVAVLDTAEGAALYAKLPVGRA